MAIENCKYVYALWRFKKPKKKKQQNLPTEMLIVSFQNQFTLQGN